MSQRCYQKNLPVLAITRIDLILTLGISLIWSVPALAPGAAEAMAYDLKTAVASEIYAFPGSGKGQQENIAATIQIKPDLGLSFGQAVQAIIAPRFRLGLSDSEFNLISPDDVYLDYFSDRLEFRIGYQTLFWGTAESVNIVDILNQRDYKGDFLEPDKLGEVTLRTRLLLADNRLDFYLFSYFTPAPLPGKVNRFNFFKGATDVSETPLYTSSAKRLRQQLAIRVDRTLGSADLGLSYFNGYEKFPILNLAPGADQADPFYYEMQQIAGDMQMSAGSWLIKCEALYQDTSLAGSFIRDSVLADGGTITRDLVPDGHWAFVGGFEYTLFGLVGISDLGLIGEYLYDSEQDLKAVAFRPFQNDLFAGLRWARNNQGDGEVLLGMVLDLKDRTQLWRAEYSERYFDRIKLLASVDLIDAAPDNPMAIFNNADRFGIELSYTY